ncbi:MAG: hydrolase [Pirellulaceae bacterium]
MIQTALPKYSLENSETGCCPRFEPGPWDHREFRLQDRLFVRDRTVNFLHIPLNMGAMIKRTWSKIQAAGAGSDEFVILSTDPSPWRGEHYFSVSKEVPDAENVRLSGTYVTRVFEGPYRNAGKWAREMQEYVHAQNMTLRKLYFYYTTCPKCAKHFGKNYVVGFAEV